MGVVMIKCPETGDAISTGIETDRERFRCSAVFFRAPIAGSARLHTSGSRESPGSTSLPWIVGCRAAGRRLAPARRE
jgi:hypothetical protein